jgi:hypothetical protein
VSTVGRPVLEEELHKNGGSVSKNESTHYKDETKGEYYICKSISSTCSCVRERDY